MLLDYKTNPITLLSDIKRHPTLSTVLVTGYEVTTCVPYSANLESSGFPLFGPTK
jgi:hypothetical protein